MLLEYLTLISLLTFIIWIYLLLFHGRNKILSDEFFWKNPEIFEKKNELSNSNYPKDKVCIIIPARNEEQTITKTLESIKIQKYKHFEVLVVNDNSSDATSERVIDFKRKFQRVTLINGKKLPSGWVGKTWALKQGVDFALKKKFRYFLFLDSDISLKKNLLNEAVNFANQFDFTMVSLMAKLNCKSFWEKLLIPPFIFFFQKLYPFNQVCNKNSNVAAAAGGFILCKATAFNTENLYNKIKYKLIDDCNLAKLLKQKGNIWLGITNKIESKRSYDHLKTIWKMVARTAFEQLKKSYLILIISLTGLFLTYLSPVIIILLCFLKLDYDNLIMIIITLNFFSISIMTIIYFPTARFYSLSKVYYLTLPVSALFYFLMTLWSGINNLVFDGNNWKGRKY